MNSLGIDVVMLSKAQAPIPVLRPPTPARTRCKFFSSLWSPTHSYGLIFAQAPPREESLKSSSKEYVLRRISNVVWFKRVSSSSPLLHCLASNQRVTKVELKKELTKVKGL
ncbi:hypothetical protein HAX54_048120 [Datura stramonium]|uniref:Uncharacterized protein n=1 Tax=Datura stramonium TaxID=4076 RepID=A0ABS8SU34_DATST|nr:hypothetical protein [Datura stramonium]